MDGQLESANAFFKLPREAYKGQARTEVQVTIPWDEKNRIIETGRASHICSIEPAFEHTVIKVNDNMGLIIQLASNIRLDGLVISTITKRERVSISTAVIQSAIRQKIWLAGLTEFLTAFKHEEGRKFDPTAKERRGRLLTEDVDNEPALFFHETDSRKKVIRIFRALKKEEIAKLLEAK